MKFGNFDILPKRKNIENAVIGETGNPELAKNKEIYGILSDPEFIKTFPGPADFQYDLIRESLISSKENAINGIAYLKDYIKTSENPLFCLVRLSRFLHTALGNQKSLDNSKEQKEISEILEKGFKDISSDDETKYFLGVNLNPDIILKQTQSFERQERGLTPIYLSEGYFVQDNGFDPIPTFYHTDNPKEFNFLIEEQKKFFESARPENRPEMTKNPTLKEMIEYKNKYLDPTINFSDIKKEIREKINNNTKRLVPEEIQKFFPSSHSTFELTQDPLMFEFRSFINPEIRSSLEKEFGIDLKDIPLKEQIYFLTSITNRTNKTIKPVQEFTKKFKGLGLRTFLSIEQGGKEMGNKILALGDGEKLPENVAKEIFKKYGELVDSVNEVTEALKQKLNFTENSTDSEDAIKNNLLLRAKNLLEKYADNLNKNPKEILEEIEKIKVENVLTLSIFQSLHEIKGIRFEDMKDFSFSYEGQLNEDEEKEGEDIINKNYKDAPKEAREAIFSSFKNAINQKDKDIIFPNLKYKGKMVSFMQLNFAKYKGSDDYGKKVYFGSFNVDPDFANGEIGSAMMERTIDSIAKTHIVEADCNAEQNIGAKYIESGFTAVDFYDFKGLPGFKIIRDDIMKNKFIGKNLSKEEIISMLDNGSKKEDLDIISASQQKDFLPEFKKILNSTKIISRYFYDKNTKRWIVVVEPNLFSKEQE
jgi:hypothetical protein